ncbi:GNAT family N-acetyltransferase [Gracilibacillus xinjiangensis]|uniref:GNAT family N-acetyltransferase n=1 Tax=Gracilibacillus xinjiangensis TaxID=1193282 RepID=A0ABV8WWC0_9BACI
MIRRMEHTNVEEVMKIWLKENISAHYFIDKKYWITKFDLVKNMLDLADIYIFQESVENEVTGFIGLMDRSYIAGLFVQSFAQSNGIGSQLLNKAKSLGSHLQLEVYRKNTHAIQFYSRHGFVISEERVNVVTNEQELVMKWNRI